MKPAVGQSVRWIVGNESGLANTKHCVRWRAAIVCRMQDEPAWLTDKLTYDPRTLNCYDLIANILYAGGPLVTFRESLRM